MPTTRPRRSPRTPGGSASWASATPTSVLCSWLEGLPYDSDEGRAWAGGHHRPADRALLRHVGSDRGADGSLRRLTRRIVTPCSTSCGCTGTQSARIDEELVPPELLSRGPGSLGHRRRARRAVRRAQRPGQRAGADRHHRSADGLRHDRYRARSRSGEDEEAGRRRDHVHRQPDGAAGLAGLRLPRRADRRDRRLHRRAQVDPRRASPGRASTSRSLPARWGTTRSTTGVTFT